MGQRGTQQRALTIGQLATRWGVSRDRVVSLIRNGALRNVFRIPSAGRFGETIKIPYHEVLEAEARWSITPATQGAKVRKPPRSRCDSPGHFKHFPELDSASEPPVDTHEAGQC